MSEKKYWQTFGERSHSEAFQESSANEFKEDLQTEGSEVDCLTQKPPVGFFKVCGLQYGCRRFSRQLRNTC